MKPVKMYLLLKMVIFHRHCQFTAGYFSCSPPLNMVFLSPKWANPLALDSGLPFYLPPNCWDVFPWDVFPKRLGYFSHSSSGKLLSFGGGSFVFHVYLGEWYLRCPAMGFQWVEASMEWGKDDCWNLAGWLTTCLWKPVRFCLFDGNQ